MSSIPHWRRALSLFGLSCAALLTFGCDDRTGSPTAITPDDQLAVSSVISSAVWRVDAQGTQHFLGATRTSLAEPLGATATPPFGGESTDRPRAGVTIGLAADDSVVGALRAFASRFESHPSAQGGGHTSAAVRGGGTSGPRRVQVPNSRFVDLPATPDGKRPQLQVLDDPRGDGRPPVLFVTYLDDRPHTVTVMTYARRGAASGGLGQGWRPAMSRTTVLDSLGRRVAVTTSAYDERGRVRTSVGGAGADGERSSVARALLAIGSFVLPDALHAQTPVASLAVTSAFGCWGEAATVAFKTGLVAAAGAALAALSASCTTTLLSCAGVPEAAIALAAAVYELAQANEALSICLAQQNAPPTVSPTPPAAPSPPTSPNPNGVICYSYEGTYIGAGGEIVTVAWTECY